MEKDQTKRNRWRLALVAVVLLGAGVRLAGLGVESLRLDESQSVWQASHSLPFIRSYMVKNVHLPLHNILLHIWMQYFGSSEVAVRLLATIPGIVFLPAFYLLAMEFLERRWAVFATLVAALSPFFVWYSREIRMYSLLALLTVLSYYFYLRILRAGRAGAWAGYAAVNLLGIYTHYFFGLVLLVHVVFFFATWKIANRRVRIRRLVGLIAVAFFLVLAFLPWLFLLLSEHGSGSFAPTLARPAPFNLVLTFFEFGFGFQPQPVVAAAVAVWPLAALAVFLLLARHRAPPPHVWLLVLGTLLPVVLTYIISVAWRPAYLTRYLTVAAPPACLLLVWMLRRLPRPHIGQVIMAAVLTAALITQHFHPQSPVKENYRAAARYLEAETTPRDVVVLTPPYLVYPFQYYYRGKAQVTTLPIWDKRKGAIPAPSPDRLAQDSSLVQGSHKRIFVLLAEDLDAAAEVRAHLDQRFTKLGEARFSPTLLLRVYQADYTVLE